MQRTSASPAVPSARLALLVIVVAFVPQAVSASCAPPTWNVENTRVQAGGSIAISGQSFMEGCDDTGGGSSPCGGPVPPELEIPMTGLRFELHRDAVPIEGITVSADQSFDVAATLPVPPDAEAGTYQVVATYHGQRQDAVSVYVTRDD